MFALERIRLIRKYLDEHRQVEVATLSALLGVSEVTIRRDLEKLETEGYLTRTHGGALLKLEPENQAERFFPENDEESADQAEIAGVAVKMIQDDDIIMLTSGDITRRIARGLEALSNVTVLTNDIRIALVLATQPQNKTVLLGGDLDPETRTLSGAMTIENLQKFYVNRLFFEVDGINDRLQLSVTNQAKAGLIKEAVHIARERIVLCTAERFRRSAFYRLGGIELASKIVTNPSLSDEYKRSVFMNNVPLFTSIHAFEGTV